MSKKKSKEYQKLWTEFQSELSNPELGNNYHGFHNQLDHLRPEYKEMFIHHQKLQNEMGELKDAILLSAMNSVSTEALSRKLRDLESASDELEDKMNVVYSKIQYNEELIKKYEDWSERKLFLWWGVFNTIDEDTKPWLEWKYQFDKPIF